MTSDSQPYSINPRRRRLADIVQLNATRLDKRSVLVQGRVAMGRTTLDRLLRQAAEEGNELATALLDSPHDEKLVFLDQCEETGWHLDAAAELRGQYSAMDWAHVDMLLEVGRIYRMPQWRVRSVYHDAHVEAVLTRLTKKSAAFRVPEVDGEFGPERLHQLWAVAIVNMERQP